MAVTPSVFWAVIAVLAVIPRSPHAANAIRSAWIPAPPPESEPAIDSARGGLDASISRPESSQADHAGAEPGAVDRSAVLRPACRGPGQGSTVQRPPAPSLTHPA